MTAISNQHKALVENAEAVCWDLVMARCAEFRTPMLSGHSTTREGSSLGKLLDMLSCHSHLCYPSSPETAQDSLQVLHHLPDLLVTGVRACGFGEATNER
jgi:hypothetical protein